MYQNLAELTILYLKNIKQIERTYLADFKCLNINIIGRKKTYITFVYKIYEEKVLKTFESKRKLFVV